MSQLHTYFSFTEYLFVCMFLLKCTCMHITILVLFSFYMYHNLHRIYMHVHRSCVCMCLCVYVCFVCVFVCVCVCVSLADFTTAVSAIPHAHSKVPSSYSKSYCAIQAIRVTVQYEPLEVVVCSKDPEQQ